MAEYYIAPKSSFDATADAIREKTGSQATIEWTEDGFADAIEDIPTGEGAVWTRPSDWPNLDALDISGDNVVYATYRADEDCGFIYLKCTTSSGQYTVEIGTISGSTFTAESTYAINSNSECRHYFGTALGGYKVIRITGNLTLLNFNVAGVYSFDGVYRFSPNAGLLEIRGKASGAGININSCKYIQHIYYLGTAPTNTSSIFSGCESLVWAELPGYVTSATTSMYNWFTSDVSLRAIDVTEWDTQNVTTLHYMFEYCYALESLDLSGWNVKKVTEFLEAFYNCHRLRILNISGWETDSAKNMQSLFKGVGVESLDLSGFKTDLVTNVSNMFQGCGQLKEVDISGWNMQSVTNSGTMFHSCSSLLGSLTIPASLTTIGASAFTNTRQIFEFHFLATTPPTLVNTNAFANMNDAGGKKIYVPYSADHSVLEAYQTATNWSTYASYIYEEAAQ